MSLDILINLIITQVFALVKFYPYRNAMPRALYFNGHPFLNTKELEVLGTSIIVFRRQSKSEIT